jgi:hypothetical protein
MVGSPAIGPGGTMPLGPGGELSGDTRRLGTNLRNDHAISFVFDSTLVTVKDPELINPGPPPPKPSQEPNFPAGIGPLRRYAGDNPAVYDSVQCTSCHNPHAVTFPRFLRAPIVDCSKAANPCPGTGLSANSVGRRLVCFFCHDKDKPTNNSYNTSTHAVSRAAHVAYPSAPYPNPGYDFDGVHNVGQASCRNCHDPHTAQGAIRLHREGVDTPGGGDAIENTCYLCHSPNNTPPGVIQPTPFGQPTLPAGTNTGFVANGQRIAPDIYSQFAKDRNLGVNAPCDQTPAGVLPKPIASAQTDCGSAMNLQLDDSLGAVRAHQPFFVKLPQEGVEFDDPAPLIVGNEDPSGPGAGQPDDLTHRHIECVDCHNPHQVTNPYLVDPINKAGRIKGMKGITHNNKVVGVETTETGCDPLPCQREVYVYEVCFRCHGNSVPRLFLGDDFPDSTVFRSNPQPGAQASNQNLSYQGFSNKRLEFSPSNSIGNLTAANMTSTLASPFTGQYEIGQWLNTFDPVSCPLPCEDPQRAGGDKKRRIGPGLHKAYHPVVAPGRNGTLQLFNQLKDAFGLATQSDLTTLTMQCTDCHNNDYYNAFKTPIADPLFMGPLTESNLRLGRDKDPRLLGRAVSNPGNYNSIRVDEPIGPHGSSYIRILRARYNTDIANTSRNFQNDGFAAAGAHFNNFLLCFQCHDRKAFDPYYPGASQTDSTMTGFFGNPPAPGGDVTGGASAGIWSNNLHMYHLVRTGAYCHECHYNVHSNAQARNTIYGSGADTVVGVGGAPGVGEDCVVGTAGCAGLPPDLEDGIQDGISDTHLLNFAPGGRCRSGISTGR